MHLKMIVYEVKQITEADFGCEDTGRTEPMALLLLKKEADDSGSVETKYVEVEESTLAAQGIEEGKKVVFTDNGEIRKYVRVVAAIIMGKRPTDGKKIIFATQRGYGEFKDGWEFPGGKIEPGETPQDALKREIKEELDTVTSVNELICTVEYDYPKFHLSMDCFYCSIMEGNLILKEHESSKWVEIEELDSVDWLPADIEVVKQIKLKQ